MGIRDSAFNFGSARVDLGASADFDYSMQTVPLDMIDEHPDNRETDQEHVEALAESIRVNGLGQLPLVRVSPDDPERFQHIAGWHRIQAFRLLAERTGDPRYRSIRVAVIHGIPDEKARELVYATNFTVLPTADRGEYFEAIAKEVAAARKAGDESLRGVRTADAVAAIAAERISDPKAGISATSVKRAMRASREKRAGIERKKADPKERALSDLAKAVSRLKGMTGTFSAEESRAIRGYSQELRQVARRQYVEGS